MKYDKTKTINHPISIAYPYCIEDFNEIVKGEDNILKIKQFTCVFLPNVEVLNLDCVVKQKLLINNTQRCKSMDITFSVKNNTNTEMVLVDFKFNIEGNKLNGIKKNDLEDKVNKSIQLLGKSLPIHNKYIFVFQSDKVQQARNRLQRMEPKIPSNYISMDLNGLINKYF